jgi:hypothetical protein
MKSATTSAPALHLGMMILFLQKRSNRTMKPTQHFANAQGDAKSTVKVLGGLSLSR